jgi:SAM-dependent methyltransferase
MTAQLRPPRGLNGLLSRAVKSFRIRQTLREIRGRTVLDLGCGLCELTAKLDANVDYTGVERDPWLYERAVQLFPRRRFLRADIEDPTFTPAAATTSFCSSRSGNTSDARSSFSIAQRNGSSPAAAW